MIRDRFEAVMTRVHNACNRSGRDPHEIELILVTKEAEPSWILEAYQVGVRDFGENRVQEFLRKQECLPKDIRWHLIGSLQTNKVKYVVGKVVLIHSLDRLELAEALQEEAEKKSQTVQVLIQVNTSGEGTKHGFRPEDLGEAAREVARHHRLSIRGLMTIGPFTDERERVRSSFRLLRRLRDQMQNDVTGADWRYLSMGMSSDFEIAIEEGANCLRIGTAVFGERVRR